MTRLSFTALLCAAASILGVAPAASALSPQTAEADARITAFTMEALKAQIGDKAFAAWPAPLRDSLVYTLNTSPAFEWSPEIRDLVLRQFRSHEAVLTPYKDVDQWLAKPDPFADATVALQIIPQITKSSKLVHNSFSSVVHFGPDYQHDAQKGAAFFGSLTPDQKKKYLEDKTGWDGGVSVSEFSSSQIKLLEDFFSAWNSPDIAGRPTDPLRLSDGRVCIGIQIQVNVTTQLDGKEKVLCADLADLLALRGTPVLIKAEREAER
ncbi:MAG: hypothetical protein JWQ02_2086 [Capsulimonas sp.]|jgi:hypothetical protein|nr:hypothetical protein [Capsulimonas sp.]